MAENYSVIAQRETTNLVAGNFVDGVEVRFQLADGTIGSVFIPEGQFDPDTVRSRIEQKVANMEAVAGL